MNNKRTLGHIAAFITILIWGTTFISTKILLNGFKPLEILFFRFVIGFAVLEIIYPKRFNVKEIRQEMTFAAAGLCGICLYYLLENIALTYTLASNVGVIISAAPLFTAILAHIFVKGEERLSICFIFGFITAMIGICLIGFNGKNLEVKPVGDILALIAAFVWACYSLLTKKISGYGYNTIQTTRIIFMYGIIFMLPLLFIFDFEWNFVRFINPVYFVNLLFLGLGASALCFVTWNYAVKILGAVKTSAYIYAVPVITIVTSVIVLNEKIRVMAIIGTALTLIGLFISEGREK
ncbi:MAG: DMT family transporter [Clostridia bacterium]|nr:DMT family transporter [Clostridia bacterium]